MKLDRADRSSGSHDSRSTLSNLKCDFSTTESRVDVAQVSGRTAVQRIAIDWCGLSAEMSIAFMNQLLAGELDLYEVSKQFAD